MAGVDGEIVLTAEAKLALADRVQHPVKPFKAHHGEQHRNSARHKAHETCLSRMR